MQPRQADAHTLWGPLFLQCSVSQPLQDRLPQRVLELGGSCPVTMHTPQLLVHSCCRAY